MSNLIHFGFSGADLTEFGFVNPPESPTGKWAFRSSSQGYSWPGYSASTIPLVYSYTAQVSQSGGTKGWYDNSATVNGWTMCSVHAKWTGDNYGSLYSITNNYGCLLSAYGRDLSAIQRNHTSGTPSVWLEAV